MELVQTRGDLTKHNNNMTTLDQNQANWRKLKQMEHRAQNVESKYTQGNNMVYGHDLPKD